MENHKVWVTKPINRTQQNIRQWIQTIRATWCFTKTLEILTGEKAASLPNVETGYLREVNLLDPYLAPHKSQLQIHGRPQVRLKTPETVWVKKRADISPYWDKVSK